MTISERDWNNYVQRMSKLDKRAGDAMAKYIAKYGTEDTEGLIVYANALVTKYGEGSAELAAQMYDELAEAEGVTVSPAEPAQPPSMAEVAKAIYRTLDSPPLMAGATSRLVKQTGADTILQNALRDGAEFAWIPGGMSCAFCLTLASRGWQRASKKAIKGGHAQHIHAHCTCTYAIRFSSKTNVAGYDPDKYLRMYENAEGSTPSEKINSMRRAQREENKELVNAQQREARRKRQERENGSGWKKITVEDSTKAGNRGKIDAGELLRYVGKPIIERDNQHVREWYVANVSDIPNQIDRSKPLIDQAKQAYALRTQYKHAARAAMTDTETAKLLDEERPALTFEELLDRKMRFKGMTKDEAIKDILKTASKTNDNVNKEFGL